MESGAGWVENDGLICGDIVQGFFGFGLDWLDIGIIDLSGVIAHFGDGFGVDFNESEVFVGSNGQADSADATKEVEDVIGVDMWGYGLEGQFINGEVDLEEATDGIEELVAEDCVCELSGMAREEFGFDAGWAFGIGEKDSDGEVGRERRFAIGVFNVEFSSS